MEKIQKKMIPIRKTTIVAFSVSAIILILTYTLSQWLIVQVEKRNFIKELETQTKESLSFTKFLFDGMLADLEHTADFLQEYDDLQNPIAKEKLNLSQRLNFYDATFVADTEGNAYSHDGYEFSIAEEGFFQAAVQAHGLTFSEILPSSHFKAIQIISLPLYANSDSRKIKGYLFGLYDITRFSKSMDTVLNSNQYLYIVDSNGNYINTFVENQEISNTRNFWNDFSLVEMQSISLEDLKDNFRLQRDGRFSYSYDDVRRYGYHMPLGIKDWQIVLSMEESIMDSRVRGLSHISTIASVINWTCLAVMLWSIYRYFKNANREFRKAHDRISRSNEIMRMAVESTNRIIFEYNIRKRTVDLKTKIPHHLFGKTVTSNVPDGFIHMNTVSDHSIEDLKNLFEQIETQASAQADIQLISKPENPVWYRIALKNIYNDDGKIISTVGSAEDISLLKQGEAAIKRKQEIHKTLINTSLMYTRVDLSTGIIHEINGEKVKLSYSEYLKEMVPQKICMEHHSYVMQALSVEKLWEEYHQGKESLEVQCKREGNPESRWTSILVYRVHEDEGANVVFVVRDIDDQKRRELALKEQAERDGLTKLYNAATTRSKIKDILSLPHTDEENQIFILLDLDNFKKINDTFGHTAGDQVLIDVAEKLKSHFRASDIVGRLGGDEFVALLCDVKSDHYIDTIAGSLLSDLTKTYTQKDTSITVSVSMGIAVSPEDSITMEELYKKADAALYQVKRKGKNGYQRWTETQGDNVSAVE